MHYILHFSNVKLVELLFFWGNIISDKGISINPKREHGGMAKNDYYD